MLYIWQYPLSRYLQGLHILVFTFVKDLKRVSNDFYIPYLYHQHEQKVPRFKFWPYSVFLWFGSSAMVLLVGGYELKTIPESVEQIYSGKFYVLVFVWVFCMLFVGMCIGFTQLSPASWKSKVHWVFWRVRSWLSMKKNCKANLFNMCVCLVRAGFIAFLPS